jgi:hypothetical protein
MTQYARPDLDVSNTGGWSPSTGSDLFAVIDESSTNDADYVSVSGGMSASSKEFEVGLGNITDPQSSADHKFVVRSGDMSGVGAVEMTFLLKQGSTTIASSGPQSMSGSPVNYTTTLSSSEADSITDYNDLRIHVGAIDSMMMDEEMRVFQAYFEAPDAPASSSGRNRVEYSPAYSPAGSPGFDPTNKSM